MPTISSKVSKRELDAIQEYANQCGETISNLIRKTVIDQAIFNGFYHDSDEYRCNRLVPENISGEEEDKLVLGNINKIRRILGLREQDEI